MTAPKQQSALRLPVPITEEGFETFIYLERACHKCNATGHMILDGVEAPDLECPACLGHRLVLSDAGRAIVALLQKWAPE